MSKIGVLETKEGKLFAGIIADEIPVNGAWKLGLKMLLPSLINGLDDKVGDKIPEPWQSYIEQLTTSLYDALLDNVVTEEELDNILSKCSTIINLEIDVPLMSEEDEALAFMFLLKTIASLIQGAFKEKVIDTTEE